MNDKDKKALRIVNHMYEGDSYSKWLGIEVRSVIAGSCVLEMRVRDEMLNGFGLAHGSITFALADSALAFASNGHGNKCLSIDTQISHLIPCNSGDLLTAKAKEISRSRKLGRYEVEVRNEKDELAAHFRGTVFVKDDEWEI